MAWMDTHRWIEDMGGGRFRATFHIKPRAYIKPGAGLREIVSNWITGDASYPHVVGEAKIRVRTASNGDRLILPVSTDDQAWFSISSPFINQSGNWVQPDLGTFTRDTNILTAQTTNVNTYITHAGHYIKAGFLLKNGWIPPNGQFAFRVGLNGLTRQGGTLLYNGKPELILRAPIVYDYDNPDDSRPISWDFVQLGGENYVLFTLPSLVGMSRPLVDPTFTDGYGGDVDTALDTVIYSTNATNNYGTSTLVYTANANCKFLPFFDLSSIASGSTCNSATFYIYQGNQGTAQAYTATIYSIASGNSGWIEGTKNGALAGAGEPCWNAKEADGSGGVTTAWAGAAGLATSGTDYDATSIGSFTGNRSDANGTEYTAALTAAVVEGWFSATNTNYGIVLWPNGGVGAWATSDHATTGYRPKLVVDYTLLRHGFLSAPAVIKGGWRGATFPKGPVRYNRDSWQSHNLIAAIPYISDDNQYNIENVYMSAFTSADNPFAVSAFGKGLKTVYDATRNVAYKTSRAIYTNTGGTINAWLTPLQWYTSTSGNTASPFISSPDNAQFYLILRESGYSSGVYTVIIRDSDGSTAGFYGITFSSLSLMVPCMITFRWRYETGTGLITTSYLNGRYYNTVTDATWIGYGGLGRVQFAWQNNWNETQSSMFHEFRLYDYELSPAEVWSLYDPVTRWELYQPVAPPRFWSLPIASKKRVLARPGGM